MKNNLLAFPGILFALVLLSAFDVKSEITETDFEIIEVKRIWDRAPHNAFTDLIYFQDQWYCAFREGMKHRSDDGKLRVISSPDGEIWSSVALMEWEGGDLRDATLTVTASGKLMINTLVRFIQPIEGNHGHSITWLSSDGIHWEGPFACPTGLGTWRWNATWHNGIGYSLAYSGKNGKDKEGCLYKTFDGIHWSIIKDSIFPYLETSPNESALVFDKDNRAFCLLRRAAGSKSALLGSSQPPYTHWEWKDLGVRVGGPALLQLSDGRLIAVVRLYDRGRTSLCLVNPDNGSLKECLELPSGGDTAYAGVVEQNGLLWISYYSTHEANTAIYLAKVRF